MVRVHAALFPCTSYMENTKKGENYMSETKQGTVKWFSAKKGYGFITGEDGTDYFAHFSQIQMDGFRNLSGKESVQFEVGEDANGRPLAVNIVPLVLEAEEAEA